MTWWNVIVALMASAPLLAGQATPGASNTHLSGVVVADADGQSLAGVYITVRTTPDALAPATRTDPDGRFELTVPAFRPYQLVVRKAGYEPTSLDVSPGTSVVVRLQGGAAIAGRVIDDAGEPVVGAAVRAGTRDGNAVRTAVTDDHGEYRLPVRPGVPLIVAVTTAGFDNEPGSSGGRVRISTPEYTTFYPGVQAVEAATPIVLMPAQLRSGIDFVVATLQSVRQPHGAFDALPILSLFVPGREVSDAGSVVQGQVVDHEGSSLSNALVLLTNERAGAGTRLARSDAAGGFEFRDVAPGASRVMAWKPGYASDDRRPVVGPSSARPTEVQLRLTPWAAVEGRVVDEFGDPLQDVHVQVLRTSRVGGRRQLTPAATNDPVTDDRGHYRIFGLEPGSYVISAQREGARSFALAGYAPSFYTGGGAPAQLITLAAGTSMTGMDVNLARAPTFRIVGRVVSTGDQPSTLGAPQLSASQNGEWGLATSIRARQLPGGQFEFTNLLDGTYVVRVYRGRPSSATEGEFGATTVIVAGADVTNVVVTTSTGSDITGSIVFESADGSREPPRADIELSPVPSDLDAAPAGNWATAGVGPDWRFALNGITGARRLAATRVPAGWTLKAVRSNGVDITDSPVPFGSRQQSLSDVEVILSDRVTRLTGRVVDSRGRGVQELMVLIFAPERGRWYPLSRYLRTAKTAQNGSFVAEGLPPGSYYVAVMPASDGLAIDETWQDPAELEALISVSSFITLAEGQPTAIVIRR
jgi:hypothetical protein